MSPVHILLFLSLFHTSSSETIPEAGAIWILQPCPLDKTVTPEQLDASNQAFTAAFEELASISKVLTGADPAKSIPQKKPHSIEKAQLTFEQSEDLYVNFEFARAAAAAGEAAGILQSLLPKLNPDAAKTLVKARVLEALSWYDAGNADAAETALQKLLAIRPNYVLSSEMAPPEVMKLFDRARQHIQQQGFGNLVVRSKPAGATVYVDGRSRGKSPISIAEIPTGPHGIRMLLPGFQIWTDVVTIEKGKERIKEAQLAPTSAFAAYMRVRNNASAGNPLEVIEDDLAALIEHSGAHALLLLGVGQRGSGTFVSCLYWTPETRASAVIHPPEDAAYAPLAAQAAASLISNPDHIAQYPPKRSLRVDFNRAALGVGPTWGRTPLVEEGSLYTRWYFWTIIGAVLAGAAATGAGLAARSKKTSSPPGDIALFDLQF